MTRLPDWRSRLAAYVDGIRRADFAYGDLDCALFASGAVAAMTGVDPAEGLRGSYTSYRAGLRKLRRLGFMDHVDAARARFPTVPVAMAQAGDLAVVETAEGPALGVVQGARIFLVGENGLMTVGLLAAKTAFRV